jgi:hypothetical protein
MGGRGRGQCGLCEPRRENNGAGRKGVTAMVVPLLKPMVKGEGGF